MKKIFLIFSAIIALSFMSCGNKTESIDNKIDTVTIDTISSDTVVDCDGCCIE